MGCVDGGSSCEEGGAAQITILTMMMMIEVNR